MPATRLFSQVSYLHKSVNGNGYDSIVIHVLITQWMCKTGLGGRVISEEFFRALEERFKSSGPGCSKGG